MLKWGGGLNNQNLNLWHSEKLFVTLSHVCMHIRIRVDLADPALSGSGDWEGSFPAWTLRRPRCGEVLNEANGGNSESKNSHVS